MQPTLRLIVPALLVLFVSSVPAARGEEIEPKYQAVIDKGLDYLVRTQNRDGHWEAPGGQYPQAMTGLAGLALLMEGSTIRDGKYAENIRKAVNWFLERSQPNGLLGNPKNFMEQSRYMYGHGYAMLFLSQVYGEEENGDRRRKLEDILTRAVQFTGKAQSKQGGWTYVSAADSHGEEGSNTVVQVQGLRACRNAGIAVPKSIMDKAQEYLMKTTSSDGGVTYTLGGGGGGRPPLTAAAIVCTFSAGEYDSNYAKKWVKFCRSHLRVDKSSIDSGGHLEFTHFYYAQVNYMLGETGYDKLFPGAKPTERLTWSKYREIVFDQLASKQASDGSWNLSGIGPVYSTACCLVILQLDNGILPIFQR